MRPLALTADGALDGIAHPLEASPLGWTQINSCVLCELLNLVFTDMRLQKLQELLLPWLTYHRAVCHKGPL